MLVFNNQQRSGYEEIASYSPRYYRSIKEMDAVFQLAGYIIDHMAGDMENMVAFQFLKYMNDESLTRYETFLGINKDSNKTLDERKSYISAMLIGSGKLSADKIKTLVNQFPECVCENVVLEEDVLHIDIVILEELKRSVRDSIYELIGQKLPAHIIMDVFFYNTMEGQIYFGSTMCEADIIELKQR